MQRIQKILELEIKEGSINWSILQPKLEASLKLVDNNFKTFREDNAKPVNVKFEDAVIFRVKKSDGVWCYKLIKPRFIGTKQVVSKGGLFASGIQKGCYNEQNEPIFPFPPVMF